jgi:hypothetical protein
MIKTRLKQACLDLQDVKNQKQHNPDHIDKVPVQFRGFDAEV